MISATVTHSDAEIMKRPQNVTIISLWLKLTKKYESGKFQLHATIVVRIVYSSNVGNSVVLS